KAGTPALAAISIQRELGNGEHRAPNISQAPVHFACVIRKDAQSSDLIGKELRGSGGIAFRNTDENHQPRADFSDDRSIHFDTGSADSLHDRAHRLPFLTAWTKVRSAL